MKMSTIKGFTAGVITTVLVNKIVKGIIESIVVNAIIQYNTNPTQYENRCNTKNVIFETREDAHKVLECLLENIRDYGSASLADLYDNAGVIGSYKDCLFGWTDLSKVYINRVRDGYILDLPKTIKFKTVKVDLGDQTMSKHFKSAAFDTKPEAEEALSKMTDKITELGYLTVAYYKKIIGIVASIEDSKYGWTDISNVSIELIHDMYIIKLPISIEL